MLRIGLLGVADIMIMCASVLGRIPPGGVLLVHLGLSVYALWLWWRSGRARQMAPVLAMALGPAMIALAMVVPTIGVRSRQRPAPGDPCVDPKQQAHRSARAMVARFLDGRVRHPHANDLGSLITILRHGPVDHRRAALETAVRSYDPRLSSVIAKTLTDEDQTIRALAAAATNRLSQRLAEERLAFAKAVAIKDAATIARLEPSLLDYSRFDILLSDTQRHQIATDVANADETNGGALHQALEAHWAAKDWAAIDALSGLVADHDRWPCARARSAARWWAGHGAWQDSEGRIGPGPCHS
ncbi:MAG: hypothetical protein V4533_15010 [Pseudomonadota bacterium]|jgi:hypothetical protein